MRHTSKSALVTASVPMEVYNALQALRQERPEIVVSRMVTEGLMYVIERERRAQTPRDQPRGTT